MILRFLRVYISIFLISAVTVSVKSQTKYRDSLLSVIKQKNNTDTAKVEIYLQIALSYKNKNYTSSIYYADSAYAVSKKINWDKGKMLYWLAYGDIARENTFSEAAVKYFKYALKIAEDNKYNDYIALVYNKIAVTYRKTDDYQQAILYHFKAIKAADSTNNTEYKLYSLNGIGICYFMLGNYAEAEKYFNNALEIAKILNNKKSMAINYNNLAELYTKKGKFKNAEQYFAKSLKINLDINDQNGIAICNNGLANLFYTEKKYYQALHYYIKAVNIEKKLNNEIQMSANFINLGKTYLKLQNLILAEEFLQKGLGYATAANSKSNIKEAYQAFTELYVEKNNYKKALEFQQKYIEIKDSLTSIEIQKNITAIQAIHDINKEKSRVAMLEQEKAFRKQKNIRNSIITIIGLVSVFGVLLTVIFYKQNRTRKKTNLELSKLLSEKEILIAEIHHRVKNNLAIIAGLVELQIQKTQNKELSNALTDTKLRIHTFAQIHESAYHIEKHSLINFDVFIHDYINNFHFKEKNNNIEFQISAQEVKLNLNSAVSLGLILNELILNAVKHAFPENKSGKILVKLFEEKNKICLTVSDNGKGIEKIPDLKSVKSSGYLIISTYAKQLNAEIKISGTNGTSFDICFENREIKTWLSEKKLSR